MIGIRKRPALWLATSLASLLMARPLPDADHAYGSRRAIWMAGSFVMLSATVA